MRKPVRNDRVVINAINRIRREGKLLDASLHEKRSILSAMSSLIEQMKFDQDHRRVATAWEKLVSDCFPGDAIQPFTWVSKGILGQR